jgi:hypothetical protein
VSGLDELLRMCLRLHAEMAHITTNLQYYINLEVVECEQQAAHGCTWVGLLWAQAGGGCTCARMVVRRGCACMHLGRWLQLTPTCAG